MGQLETKDRKKINMKVTIVLDGSDLSASTLKHFFTKIYDSALHEISFLYALPNFSVSTGKVTTYPLQNFVDIRNEATEFLIKTEKLIREQYNPSQQTIESSFCTFGLSKNDKLSIDSAEAKFDQVVGKNLVASVMQKFSEEQPDAVVFACRGYFVCVCVCVCFCVCVCICVCVCMSMCV